MNVHECVSFLLIKDDKVLLEKRSKAKDTEPGMIAIPGGHLESKETQKQALYRELKEELDVIPKSYQFLCSLYHPTEVELQLLHYYVVTNWDGDIAAYEADEVIWFPLNGAPVATETDQLALSEFFRVNRYLFNQ